MFSTVSCPTCQHKFSIPEGAMGKRRVCPNCRSPFFAGQSVADGPASELPSSGAQPSYAKTMLAESAPPIKYTCPRCKASLEAPASEAGTKKNCPHCTQRLQVPAPPSPPPAVAPPNLNKTMLAMEESPAPPIHYKCPNCKKPLEASANEADTKKHCPYCTQKHKVPAQPRPEPVPPAHNLNKTMLVTDESTASPSSGQSGYQVPVPDSGRSPAVPSGLTPESNRGHLADMLTLTPRNVAIGVGVLLFVLFILPAVLRGGKSTDAEALAKAQLELEKLKADIELKKAELEQQKQAEAATRRAIDELVAKSRQQAEETDNKYRLLLRTITDQKKKAELEEQLNEDRRKLEQQKREMEKEQQKLLADTRQKLEETRRALEAAQQKQQTIIHQPPPVVYYPPYHPRYYWWW